MKFNKKLIIPILTLIAMLVKTAFKIDIPDAAVDLSADIIGYVIALVGMFIHPKVTETGGPTNDDQKPTVTIGDNR
ncbi:hypothetical protein [Paenibacillus sp. LjRoot56]|uniref:hypothetical protein n=1 Tax=Paenibacillus sp. LjRoot56 TaxID=3342333 RepID=UPI003ED01D71